VPTSDDISQHPRSSKINTTELILICTDIQKLMGKSNDITCANVILNNGSLTLTSLQEGEITQKKEKVKFKSTLELNLNHNTVNHLLKLLANSTGDVDILSLANNVIFQTNNGTMKENVPPEVNTLVERYRLEHEDIMPFVLSKAELSQALGQVIIPKLRNSNTRLFFYFVGSDKLYLLTKLEDVGNTAKLNIVDGNLQQLNLISVNLDVFSKKYSGILTSDEIIIHLALPQNSPPSLRIYNSLVTNIPELECEFEIEQENEHTEMLSKISTENEQPKNPQDDLFGFL
jgi:hypothetical protein